MPSGFGHRSLARELPADYLESMAACARRRWINLEYLSAEPLGAKPSRPVVPHPRLALIKHFSFPAGNTGGLLREQNIDGAASASSTEDADADLCIRLRRRLH